MHYDLGLFDHETGRVECADNPFEAKVTHALGIKRHPFAQNEPAVRWRPQGDSNPRYRRERAMSWASRRWGRRNRSENGGARRDRTADLLHAMQALSQLSYGPTREAGKVRNYALNVNEIRAFS